MRKFLSILLMAVSLDALAQTATRMRATHPMQRALSAEGMVKQAFEDLGKARKFYEQDLKVLRHVRTAERALSDAIQPSVAVQKAYEEVTAAKALATDFLLIQGLTLSHQELEAARRSPGAADLGRLRSIVQREALGPASRVAIRNAKTLQEESLAWVKVQQLISEHIRMLAEITGESLVAAEE